MEVKNQFEFDVNMLISVLKKEEPSMKIVKLDTADALKAGDNYMSSVGRVTVELQDGNNNKIMKHLLVKKIPTNEAWREAFGCDFAFQNEQKAYMKIIPEMKRLCPSYNPPLPECLYASTKCVILEDLKAKGFRMADRRKGLNLSEAMLALKELGKFHGTSLAMKHLEPTVLQNIYSEIQKTDFLRRDKNSFDDVIKSSLSIATLGLKVFRATGAEEYLENAVYKIKMLKSKAFNMLLNLSKPTEPLSVICHGDFYINNMLFRYDDEGNVESLMVVDLQGVRYASLSLDLLYFLYTSLQPGLVANHHDQLLQEYHRALNQQIGQLAPNVPKVSLSTLYNELESHSAYGLIMGLLVLPAITALPTSAFAPDDMTSLSCEEFFERGLDMLSPEYFRRLRQLVTDFTVAGYL